MRRGTRLRLSLLVVAGVLAGLVWWTAQRDLAGAAPATLLPLPASAITEIEVRVGDGESRRFVRGPDGWQMLAPLAGPADAAHLERLAAIAEAEVLRWRPATDFDPAKIGLAPPWASIRLNDQRLLFGSLAALAPQRYVLAGDHVALIPARYAADISATPESELALAGATLPTL